jgi:RHS repeat-associated protein
MKIKKHFVGFAPLSLDKNWSFTFIFRKKRGILAFLVLFPIMVIGQTQTENYIINTVYKTPTTVSIATPTILQANQNITYYDGLGRPIQQIAHQQSGSGKDIVTPIKYDTFGRQPKDYLPYVPNSPASLNYKSSALIDVGTFYNTAIYENTLNPYSEKEFEASPLNRVLKQAAQGNDWAIGSGNETQINYQTNTATEVKLFQATALWDSGSGLYGISFLDNGNYGANQLYKTITLLENAGSYFFNKTEEFKNKEGQVVLKRTYGNSTANGVTNGVTQYNATHDTYYVYDQYGNLTYVIPPKADGAITQAVLDDLCYQYKYDNRNHLVEKKLPGKQWEFIVYDKLDRLVATGPVFSPFGDGAIGWMITKYDVLSRVVYTGWYAATVTAVTRFGLQNDQNNLTTANYETKTSSGTIDGISAYYTNLVSPTSFKLLTVNYYDDYNFPNAPSPVPLAVLSDNSQAVYYNNTQKPIGLATGSWVRVLQTPADINGESSYILYDIKARPVRTYTKNYFGSTAGNTFTDTKIDFSGKVLLSETKHKRLSTDTEIKTTEVFTYSPQDRLLSHTHQINTDTPQLLAENSYDELGQLISKKVGNNSTNPLQKVDYFHNIRGWLTGINNINNLVQGNDPKDLFTFRINYNNLSGYNFSDEDGPLPIYNGTITELFWRTASDNVLRGYQFGYDTMNRLDSALYGKEGLGTKSYNEGVIYDKNGNIMMLSRYGDSDNQIGNFTIDNLRYTYLPNSNKLLNVKDDFYNTSGFNDGNTVGDDYDYDTNGNMTVDRNKNITNITYNHLNLPTKITFGTTGNIVYIYNAVGQKLGKLVTVNTPASITVTNYFGGFQYQNNVLQFFPTAEGYVKNTAGVFSYVFNYKDHLGNTRVSYQDKNNDGTITITNNEILEESNYYPFGLKHNGYNSNNAQLDYKYKYNGKELQDDNVGGFQLNVYDYQARNYDPALGRWMNVDPLAETSRRFSPYNYAFDNPVYFIDPDGMRGSSFDNMNPNGNVNTDQDNSLTKPPVNGFDVKNETVYTDDEGTWIMKDGVWVGQNGAEDIKNEVELSDVVVRGQKSTKGKTENQGKDYGYFDGYFKAYEKYGGKGENPYSPGIPNNPLFHFVGNHKGVDEYESIFAFSGAFTPGPFVVYPIGGSKNPYYSTHEPGHVLQYRILGAVEYWRVIALPSLFYSATHTTKEASCFYTEISANILWNTYSGEYNVSNPIK